MSQDPENPWDEVERAAVASTGGMRDDADDRLSADQLREAALNPHGKGKSGRKDNGPGMMPPMMMGGGAGGTAGPGGAGGVGLPTMGGLSGAASMGMRGGGMGPGAVPGGGGVAAASGSANIPDGARWVGTGWDIDGDGIADLDPGGNPLRPGVPGEPGNPGGPSWEPPVGRPVDPWNPTPPGGEDPYPPDYPDPPGYEPPGPPGYEPPDPPGYEPPDPPGYEPPDPPGYEPPHPPGYEPPSSPEPGFDPPPSSVPPGGSVPPGSTDHTTDPDAIVQNAREWAELADEIERTSRSMRSSNFGMVWSLDNRHGRTVEASSSWAKAAGSEFEEVRNRLLSNVDEYLRNEEEARRRAERVSD